jgi:hypothetical protein
VHA